MTSSWPRTTPARRSTSTGNVTPFMRSLPLLLQLLVLLPQARLALEQGREPRLRLLAAEVGPVLLEVHQQPRRLLQALGPLGPRLRLGVLRRAVDQVVVRLQQV